MLPPHLWLVLTPWFACIAACPAAGGICPGMNDIIQALCKRLADYGVHEESVLGIR